MPKGKLKDMLEDERLAIVQRLRNVASPGFTVLIERETTSGRDFEWLAEWSADRIPDEPVLSAEWGGGTYRLTVRDSSKQFVKGGRGILRIAGAPKITRATGGDGAAVDPTVKFAFEMLRDIQKEQLKPKETRPLDWPAIILAGSAAVTALHKVFERAPGQPPVTMKDLLEEFKALRDMEADLRPEATGDNSMWGGALNALAEFGKLIREQGERGGAAPPQPQLPGSGAEAPPPDAPKPEAPPVNGADWTAAIRDWVPDLLGLAQSGRTPGTYAEVMLDQAEARQPLAYQFIASKMGGSAEAAAEFEREFMAAFPECAQHAEWFRAFFAAVREMLGPEPGDDASKGPNDTPAKTVAPSPPSGPETT